METIREKTAAEFINALVKSIQTLCYGCLDFQNGVDIMGHINLSVDKGNSQDYILKEKVFRNAENCTLFISNSFHAEPKPEMEVPGKTSPSGNHVTQNSGSRDTAESDRVSSAISSISMALTDSRARTSWHSYGEKDSASHSQKNTPECKASEDDSSEFHHAKISDRDHQSKVMSDFPHPCASSSPGFSSKERCQASRTAAPGFDSRELPHVSRTASVVPTVLPSAHRTKTDSCVNLGCSLTGNELEPVTDQRTCHDFRSEAGGYHNFDLTLVKKEVVKEEESAGSGVSSVGQCLEWVLCQQGPQRGSGTVAQVHQSSGNMGNHPRPLYQHTIFPQTHSPFSSLPPSALQRFRKWKGKRKAIGTLTNSRTRDDQKTLKCEFCEAPFASVSGLKSHKARVHLNTLPYRCSLCGKGFTKPDNYEGHMNMHNNVKAFKCPHCSKGYPYKTSLNLHLRVSTCRLKRLSVD